MHVNLGKKQPSRWLRAVNLEEAEVGQAKNHATSTASDASCFRVLRYFSWLHTCDMLEGLHAGHL